MKPFVSAFARIVAAASVLAMCSSCLVGKFMCNYALLPEEHGNEFEADRAKVERRTPGVTAWFDNLAATGVIKDTTLVGRGGYKLYGVYAPAADPANAKGTAVVVHGYTDNIICYLHLMKMYREELNYNVVAPELHYHGHSEGVAVQMGWFDRFDVAMWIEFAHEKFADDFVVAHGVSMGAATVMMLSGDPQPEYVKAFVEDCGYSSVWDQFANNLKDSFHLPTFPVLNSASYVCKRRYGWSFKEASSVEQLKKSTLPMLFIHGDADDFVPFPFLDKCYEAKTEGYKDKWVAPGSEHAAAYRDHPQEYTRRVGEFLEKVKSL